MTRLLRRLRQITEAVKESQRFHNGSKIRLLQLWTYTGQTILYLKLYGNNTLTIQYLKLSICHTTQPPRISNTLIFLHMNSASKGYRSTEMVRETNKSSTLTHQLVLITVKLLVLRLS